MGELSDRCQCCFVHLDSEWLSYRCPDCAQSGECQVPKCGKCRLHCEHASQMVISGGTGPVVKED